MNLMIEHTMSDESHALKAEARNLNFLWKFSGAQKYQYVYLREKGHFTGSVPQGVASQLTCAALIGCTTCIPVIAMKSKLIFIPIAYGSAR